MSLCSSGVAVDIPDSTVTFSNFTSTITFGTGSKDVPGYSIGGEKLCSWVPCTKKDSYGWTYLTTCYDCITAPTIDVWPSFSVGASASATVNYNSHAQLALSTGSGLAAQYIQSLSLTKLNISFTFDGNSYNTGDLWDSKEFSATITNIDNLTTGMVLQDLAIGFPSIPLSTEFYGVDTGLIIDIAFIFCPDVQFALSITLNFSLTIDGVGYNASPNFIINIDTCADA
jgi:hypothetical protein